MKTDVYQTPEAAKLMGYTNRAAFIRAVRRDGIPHIKQNARRFVFPREAFEKWLASRTVGGGK